MSVSERERAAAVKKKADALGFDAAGIAGVGEIDAADKLGTWLSMGYHADMRWMEETRALRQEVRLKLPAARSVIVVAKNYYQQRPPQPSGTGRIARYAWGRDYHKVLKKPLRVLAAFVDSLEPGAASFVSVDSGPVLERSWAARAGIGWIGKNSLVLRRDLGSWFFLGTVVSTVGLAPDTPQEDLCGSCVACLEACPTQAIVAPQIVDSRRCISYQTIENRGAVPNEISRSSQDWVFGCDICQEVCPWTRFAKPHSTPDFVPREDSVHPSLEGLLALTESEFNERYAGSAIRRAKFAGMRRNADIAAQNTSSSD